MKRKYMYKVKVIKPFFVWEQCQLCKEHFRREKGYKIIVDQRVLYSQYFCCCSDCVKSIDTAYAIAEAYLSGESLNDFRMGT